MSTDPASSIKQFLPPGTKLTGRRDSYTVEGLICLSNRSVTVSCRSSSGTQLRLKFFNGENAVSKEMQEMMSSLSAGGVALPADYGTYAGRAFYVFPKFTVTDTAKTPVPLRLLSGKLIPLMANVMAFYHSRHILLRDICPEHILYQVETGRFAYCGLGNAAHLSGRATVTREPGFGQGASFTAPETAQIGYSMASDYYALGVTLLTLVLGKNPIAELPSGRIPAYLAAGRFGHIQRAELESRSWDSLSEQDRVSYLICGLLDADPAKRWGYWEVRCWLHGQGIPLVRKTGRIWYQYYHPFFAEREECWNRKQLVRNLAASRNGWTEATAKKLDAFLKEQDAAVYPQVSGIASDTALSGPGKIFHFLYGLEPGLDGLWWKGMHFSDSQDLVRRCAGNGSMEQELALMLKSHCLSFFLLQRKKAGGKAEADIAQIHYLEECEISEEKNGVNRLCMYFLRDPRKRTFSYEGRTYAGLMELLSDRRVDKWQLRQNTQELFRDKRFQAWLWAAGFEETVWAAAAEKEKGSDESFFVLMKIAEKSAGDKNGARLARDTYLRYGDYAPVLWLHENMHRYKAVTPGASVISASIRDADLNPDRPLEELLQKAEELLLDYQMFVTGLRTNSLAEVSGEELRYAKFSYYTTDNECLITESWNNGLEVCRRFLKDTGCNGTERN